MANPEEIKKAIGAHGLWKQRLRDAIDKGKSEFTVERVKPDNLCDFGKWLYSLPPAERNTDNWKKIQQLHAEFHQEAARILGLALGNQKSQAESGIAPNSKFATLSSTLTAAMMAWQKS